VLTFILIIFALPSNIRLGCYKHNYDFYHFGSYFNSIIFILFYFIAIILFFLIFFQTFILV